MKLIYGIKDKPRFSQLIVFAFQQLLAIMAATLVVPVITNNNANLTGDNAMSTAAALFGAGIGTLIYVLFTQAKSPVFLGSSFAFLGSMAAAFAGAVSAQLGFLGLIIGAFFAGLVYVVIAIIVKCVGVNWINKIMPAVVIGPTVAIIGLSLAGNAINDVNTVNHASVLNTDNYQIVEKATDDGISYTVVDKDVDISNGIPEGSEHKNITVEKSEDGSYTLTQKGSVYVSIICALVTLAVTILCSTFGKKVARLIPFIIGICSGYAVASIFYIIGSIAHIPALMIIDYSSFNALVADGVTLNTFISLPNFTFLTAWKGISELSGSYIASIAVAYIPVAFVVFAEHIADHKNISTIIEKDLLTDPGLSRTLLGDGVGSMFGAFFGGCPNTTYGESIGCVAITGNASVATIITAAVCAMIISFLNPFIAFVNSIPSCVMGGVCIALYGFIAVSGLKMIQKVDLEDNHNLFVASVILITGIGGMTVSFGAVTITSIACALILGILTNVMLSGKKEKKEASDSAEK